MSAISKHETRSPAYWAVIPAPIRHDKNLRPNAKLLYAELSALADSCGYCWASNEYLAKLFDIATRTVSDLISGLAKSGYITVKVLRDPKTNEVLERRIWIDQPPIGDEMPPIAKNGDTPPVSNSIKSGYITVKVLQDPKTNEVVERRIWIDRPPVGEVVPPPAKNGDTPPADFGDTPPAKNGAENDYKALSNIPPTPQGGTAQQKAKRGPKKAADWKPERFAAFWAFYAKRARGENKQGAMRAWDRLKPSEELIAQMGQALMRQIATEEWQRGVGIPYASTWLNNRRWEDLPKTQRPPDGVSGRVVEEEGVTYI